jgi:hypothetical protein
MYLTATKVTSKFSMRCLLSNFGQNPEQIDVRGRKTPIRTNINGLTSLKLMLNCQLLAKEKLEKTQNFQNTSNYFSSCE